MIGVAFALGRGADRLPARARSPPDRSRNSAATPNASARRRSAAWRVRADYGTPEVDDVARTLNSNLELLAEETARRGAALESARSFAASAAHELRTPLQSALTSLDIARSGRIDAAELTSTIDTARRQLERMAASLAAVRALTDAELADPTWFETLDLVELVDAVVADETRRDRDAQVTVDADVRRGDRGLGRWAAPRRRQHRAQRARPRPAGQRIAGTCACRGERAWA